jgi:hypothetical protein
MSKFLEIHESQDYTNITPAEALTIMQDHLATYNEGERFKRSYQRTRDALEAIYGGKINKKKSISTGANNNVTSSTKTSYIIKNDDVKEDEKFRYIRIQQTRNILKKNISKSAHHLWSALQMSPNSNSLGAFEITLRELQYQTISDSINDVVNDLNELQQQGELFYFNDVVYLTHFHSNQKQHGNDMAIKGILNNYNSLKDNQKLPFIRDFDTKNITMKELEEGFFKLKRAIELMGMLYSGVDIDRSEMLEVWSSEQVDSIVNGVLTLEESQPSDKVTLKVDVKLISVEQVAEDDPQQDHQNDTSEVPIEVSTQEEDIIEAPKMQVVPHSSKISDKEIIQTIITTCDLSPQNANKLQMIINDNVFNNLYHYIRGGGGEKEIIRKYFGDALHTWSEKQKTA